MSRILITGATGFLGRHLTRYLADLGHRTITTNSEAGDIAVKTIWSALAASDVVVHLAGKVFVPDSWANPEEFLKCNVMGTTNALSYCVRHRAKLVFLSSYLYGAPDALPISESARLVSNSPYALSKKVAEEICQFYSEKFGLDVTVLRPFNVYGPGQSSKFLIPSIVNQAVTGREIRVKDLEPKRDYIYVMDLVRAIVLAIAERRGFSIYNIGSGTSYSVAEVIDTIQSVWGTRLPVVSESIRRKDEVMDTVADISAANRSLAWVPKFSLLDGFRDMFAIGNKS